MPGVNRPERDLRQIQQGFADHIRSPQERPCPQDVPLERMAVYRELFFNNISGFLADSFPVLHRMLPQKRWLTMVRDFYQRHACKTPYFTRLGEEFLAYLRDERGEVGDDPPFLAELAHYEWVELALALSEEEPFPTEPIAADLRGMRMRLSPLAWPLSYRYPVHRIGAAGESAAVEARTVHLLVYRDPDEQVVFLEIDAATHALLSALRALGEADLHELLETLAELTRSCDRDAFIQRGLEVVGTLQQRGVIGRAAGGPPAGAGFQGGRSVCQSIGGKR